MLFIKTTKNVKKNKVHATAHVENVCDANNFEHIGARGVVIAAQVEKPLEDGRRDGAGELRVLRGQCGGTVAAHRAHHAIGNLSWYKMESSGSQFHCLARRGSGHRWCMPLRVLAFVS